MARKQSLVFHTSRKRTRRSSGISLRFIGLILAIILVVLVLGHLLQFLQTPTGLFSFLIMIVAITGVLVLRHRMLKNRRQESARLQYAQQEWERQERERLDQERIARMKSLGDILVLTPREFEELTRNLLAANGFHSVQIVGGSGDLGVDIFAYDQNGYKCAVQCKRYAPGNTIGSPTIQTFFGMMVHHQVQKGIFVTTSTFSRPAIDLASQRNIQLINGDQLIRLLQSLQQRTS